MSEFLPLRTRKGDFPIAPGSLIGVLNITPDSFFDGGRFLDAERAVQRACDLAAAGARIIDVGGESTRPGAPPVAERDEIERVLPVLHGLARRITDVPISIDTRKAAVAEAALEAGADLVNDVSGLADANMGRVVARFGVPIILGHLRGDPATMMQRTSTFDDVVANVVEDLAVSISRATNAGIERDQIVVDPGLGFGKTPEQTIELLVATTEIRRRLARPVCLGPSRKAFIGAITGAAVGDRLFGTAGAAAVAAFLGAEFLRLHDVGELRDTVAVASALGAAHVARTASRRPAL